MAALGHATPLAPPPRPAGTPRLRPDPAPPRFVGFVGGGLAPTGAGRGATCAASFVFHVALILVLFIVPLFFQEILPVPGDVLRAFFVVPPEVAPPPPPPPPPPPAGARALQRAPAVARPVEPSGFVAPVEIPEALPEVQDTLDLGVEGGAPGGVVGGVPGGVVGGIVGGLPSEAAPPPPKVVRVGGKVTAPKLAHSVRPEYPTLAIQARLQGIVILEAKVGIDGRVQTVTPLRGSPLLLDSAVEAVKQWRYQPLLLNGMPVEFILTVTIVFNLNEALQQ